MRRLSRPLDTKYRVLAAGGALQMLAVDGHPNLDTADGQRVVDITLGLQTDERVEIVSGLNEGDIVAAP